jgi:hypothetical protein
MDLRNKGCLQIDYFCAFTYKRLTKNMSIKYRKYIEDVDQ